MTKLKEIIVALLVISGSQCYSQKIASVLNAVKSPDTSDTRAVNSVQRELKSPAEAIKRIQDERSPEVMISNSDKNKYKKEITTIGHLMSIEEYYETMPHPKQSVSLTQDNSYSKEEIVSYGFLIPYADLDDESNSTKKVIILNDSTLGSQTDIEIKGELIPEPLSD